MNISKVTIIRVVGNYISCSSKNTNNIRNSIRNTSLEPKENGTSFEKNIHIILCCWNSHLTNHKWKTGKRSFKRREAIFILCTTATTNRIKPKGESKSIHFVGSINSRK